MIIFDFNQVVISSLKELAESDKDISIDLARHLVLNTLRTYVKKYKATHGPEVIIACDNRKYWRKTLFPHYKASRKKTRQASGLNWEEIFKCLEVIKEELIKYSHYKVLEIDTVEADDIIATLCVRQSPYEKIMILSSDKDFVQLQAMKNVEQYSPILKKEIKDSNPLNHLKELIIRGDKGDGIPNILSADDSYVNGVRQKSIYEEKLAVWLNQSPEVFCENEEILKNYRRNESLIDLSKIPEDIRTSVIHSYENTKPKTKMQFINYLVANRLKNLIEVANEF
jgi:hypothetical protein